MNARGIIEGTRVEFEILYSSGEKTGKKFSGEFYRILDDMDIIIFTLSRQPEPLLKNMRISASFNHQTHGPINFCGTISFIEETKTGTKFYIRIDDELLSIKKRDYFRAISILKANYRLINSIRFESAETKNISYNGVCIITDKVFDIKIDSNLELEIWLWEDLKIELRCQVRRVTEYELNGKMKYELGLQITSINSQDKEYLTKYLTNCVAVWT